MAGERGAADAERDVRGFAMKFYTEEGNWDLVGNNTPVFFVRDPYKFPDFIRTQKRDPKTNLRSPTAMWDFWSLSPESLHQVTILFSDRGLPKSYRHVNGYGSHTYSLINASNERFWVKFHFKTMQGIACLTDAEAAAIVGHDRESHQRDLFEAIERRDFPKWRLMVQIMPEADADKTPYNPFDLTKVWPHGDYPLIEVGIMELNRNPENYFAEVEQAAFSPANVVPGISHSPDKMLQFRIFSYADAHRYRLGVNYESPAGQPAALPGPHLSPGRIDAVRRQPDRTPITSRTASADRPRTTTTRSRRCRSPATPTATIIGSATTTSASRAPCSRCSMRGRGSGCSPTSPTRRRGSRTSLSSVSWRCSTRCILTMARVCARLCRGGRRRARPRSRRRTALAA